MGLRLRSNEPGGLFLKNPPDGGSFGWELRCRGRHSPLRGYSGHSASLPAKIPRRRTPRILKTRPNAKCTRLTQNAFRENER